MVFSAHNVLLFCLWFCLSFISFCFNEINATVFADNSSHRSNSSWNLGITCAYLKMSFFSFLSPFFLSFSSSRPNEMLHCCFWNKDKGRKEKAFWLQKVVFCLGGIVYWFWWVVHGGGNFSAWHRTDFSKSLWHLILMLRTLSKCKSGTNTFY